MITIGIGGTNGSGKDTVGQMLADRYGFLFVSATDLLRDEARRRGLPVERKVLRTISAEWRRMSGLGVLVDKSIEAYEMVKASYPGGIVVASLRNPGEAERVHELGGTVVWVDADPKVRFGRINARLRGDEDRKTFEQFMAEEKAEMSHSGDEATLNMNGVKEMSDIFISNDGNNIEEFKSIAERRLQSIIAS